jgi:predicted RNase H-like nuclease
VVATFADVLALGFDVVAVDMPIGVSDDSTRSCEREARTFISPRGSTIFPTPVRGCLDAASYRDACDASRAAIGRAISKQAWNILPKIREIDELITPAHTDSVIESHPECAFAVMNDAPLRSSKHTAAGLSDRAALLAKVAGIAVPDTRVKAKRDDVLDAFAVLWSAERFARGEHRTFGGNPVETDPRGVPMRIVV